MNFNRPGKGPDPAAAQEEALAKDGPDRSASDSGSPHGDVSDLYLGFLAWTDAAGHEGSKALASSAVSIGSALEVERADDGSVTVSSPICGTIGELNGKDADRAANAIERGWTVRGRLSLVAWNSDRREFSAEVAIICHDPSNKAVDEAVERFSAGLGERMASGDHPTPALLQDRFDEMVESGGSRNFASNVPIPKKDDGFTVFRSRRTLADRLTEASATHRVGCTIASFAFIVALIATIAALVIFLS